MKYILATIAIFTILGCATQKDGINSASCTIKPPKYLQEGSRVAKKN